MQPLKIIQSTELKTDKQLKTCTSKWRKRPETLAHFLFPDAEEILGDGKLEHIFAE